MRIVVCAYSEVGHACLDELLRMGADVALVVTHRDSPGESIWFGSVADRARAAGVPTLLPDDANAPEVVEAIAAARPDLLFSFYFRQMMKRSLLATARHGALNLHGSLLPAYRGRAPVNWVLVNGETETGVTLHYMDEKPDHGDVVARRRVAIDRDDTALTLTRKLAAAGRETMREALPLLESGRAPREPQDHARSSYFGGRKPADGAIDWTWPAERVRNLVRAVTEPWPGAFTHLGGEPLLVWWAETAPALEGARPGAIVPGAGAGGVPRVACGEGAIDLVSVGWRGEKTDGARWLAAAGPAPGARFDAPAAAGKERT
ncbi:formyltransferase [bacterium]|nr:formyltransferase [bacterium]